MKNFLSKMVLTMSMFLFSFGYAQAQQRAQMPNRMYDCSPTNNGHFSTLGTLFFFVFDAPYVGTIRYFDFNGLRPVEYNAMLSFYDFNLEQPSWWAQFVALDLEHEEESRAYQTVLGVTDMNRLISSITFVGIVGELVIDGSGGPTTF